MTEPNRETVREAVERAFPGSRCLSEMVWSSLNGCWFWQQWGMTIGIEVDGYIHS